MSTKTSKSSKAAAAAAINQAHEEKKIKGLINGVLAQHLYFTQNATKEEERLHHEHTRFINGTKQLKKKMTLTKKRRAKSEAYATSQEDRYQQLKEDTLQAKKKLKELNHSMEMYREEVASEEMEVKHDLHALEGLNTDISSQVKSVLQDVHDIDLAINNWTSNSNSKIANCKISKERCYSAFDDWSKLWPGIHSWLNTETTSIVSTKTVATLQRVIGEWRSLRSIAVAIKVMIILLLFIYLTEIYIYIYMHHFDEVVIVPPPHIFTDIFIYINIFDCYYYILLL